MKDKEGTVRFHIGGVSYGSTLIKAAVFFRSICETGKTYPTRGENSHEREEKEEGRRKRENTRGKKIGKKGGAL